MSVIDRKILCFITYQSMEGLSHIISGRAYLCDRDPHSPTYM